jgi:hypothetical protein
MVTPAFSFYDCGLAKVASNPEHIRIADGLSTLVMLFTIS